MKKTLLSILLLCGLTIAGFAQTLSGEYNNDGKSTGSYYTKINWQVSYRFEEKDDRFYIKFYSPKITVPNYSHYHDEFHKEYSLADLGLARWPNARQMPFAMSVKINVSDGYNNYEVTAGCDADFTCNDSYIVSKANVKNVTLQNFRVTSVTYFRANLGGEPAVDEILKSRRQSAGRTSTAANNGTSTISNTSNVDANSSSANGTTTTEATPSYILNYPNAGTPSNTASSRKSEQTMQILGEAANLVGGLLDNMNANRERKLAAEAAETARQSSIDAGIRVKKHQEWFTAKYLPLMDKAIAGDEKSRMTLYFASKGHYSGKYVPLREEWFETALRNNNTDALMEMARLATGEPRPGYDFKEGLPYLEKAASLGNVDAMVILAGFYDIRYASSQLNTTNAEKALQWLNKAAELGSPNAMYCLGMIYKYGGTADHRKALKYNVVLDEKVALDWFTKSLLPDYEESLYCRSLLHNGRFYYETASYFNKDSYSEIAKIYEKGKGVLKDKAKAAAFASQFSTTSYESADKQKFFKELNN